VALSDAGGIEILGYEARFEREGSTVDLLPTTRFQEYITTDLSFNAAISADGYAKLPDQIGELSKEILNIGAGAELQLGTRAGIVGKLTLSLKTPKIQAVGNASPDAVWQLNKDKQPLVGDQVLVQTVVVPRGRETLRYTLKGFAVIDPGLFRRPVRLETEVVSADVDLLAE
jgi:hypothetical protein